MASELGIILLLKVWPVSPGGTEELVIITSVQWESATTDTPASTPAVATFDAASWALEKQIHRQQEDGLLLLGGVERVKSASLIIKNARDEDDDTRPLDSYAAYRWSGVRAELWDAPAAIAANGLPTTRVPLADFTQRESLRINSISFGDEDVTLSVTAPDTFETSSTPFTMRGWGYAARAIVNRADQAATRGTGSFTVRWIMKPITGNPTPADVHNGQIWRLQVVGVPPTTAVVALRQADASWASFVTNITISVLTYQDIHVTYNSSTTKARLYVAGVFTEEITITGGLWASSVSQTLSWTSSPNWYCGGWYFLSSVLTDDDITKDHNRGILKHPDMVAGLAFDEGTGKVAYDITGVANATVVSGIWDETGQGDAELAGIYPPAIVGMAFGLPLFEWYHQASKYSPGFAGEYYFVRHATEDGRRLGPGDPDTTAITRTIVAAEESISNVPNPSFAAVQDEFAPSQTLTRSPAGGAGNPTSMTVGKVITDPILGNAEVAGSIVTTTDQTANETSSFSLTETSRDYAAVFAPLQGAAQILPGIEMLVAPEGELAVSMARQTGMEAESAIKFAVGKLGPELTPVITHEDSTAALWHHGWRIEGEAPFREGADRIALSSFATDGDGPLAVGFEPDGDAEVYGLRLDSTTDDFTIPDVAVSKIIEITDEARPAHVTIEYARCWQTAPHKSSLLEDDSLTREFRQPWRNYQSGSGNARGRFQSSVLRPVDAKRQAAALLRINEGRVFRVDLFTPVDLDLIHDAVRGRRGTITWQRSATWASGVQCLVVGSRQKGPDGLSLYVWCEV